MLNENIRCNFLCELPTPSFADEAFLDTDDPNSFIDFKLAIGLNNVFIFEDILFVSDIYIIFL